MTSNDKQLLLVDLSARLPYNIAIDCRSEDSRFTCYLTTDMLREIQNNRCYWEYKPYLFPLSSMTREQSKIYHELIGGMFGTSALINFEVLEDFFHKNHLDYRELIPKGLALDATGLNIY
jgi:hypothetical protein